MDRFQQAMFHILLVLFVVCAVPLTLGVVLFSVARDFVTDWHLRMRRLDRAHPRPAAAADPR